MEQFKEKLKIDNLLYGVSVFFLAAFWLLSVLGLWEPVVKDSHWHDAWRGFVTGASSGLLGVMTFFLVRNLLALKDEKKLKKLYIQENDERLIQVWTKARASALQAFLLLGLVAIIIAGYFSPTVSITILGCVLFGSLLGIFFKIYWNIKL